MIPLFSWLRNRTLVRTTQAPKAHRLTSRHFRPRLEALEDRCLPSTFYAATASDLIADIKAANLQGGANTIALTAPTTSPYVLTGIDNNTDGPTGTPVIARQDSLTIVGNGDTIDAGKHGRLFDVAQGASLTLDNMTLKNGLESWGGYAKGGAIYNQGTLVLSEVYVEANTATDPTGYSDASGGGIWSNGSLTVENSCRFNDNSATIPDYYGIRGNAFGGALCIAGGTANITDSTFGVFTYGDPLSYGNNAVGLKGYGGAVYVGSGTVSMSGDTVGTASGVSFTNSVTSWSFSSATGVGHGVGYGGGLCLSGGTILLTNDSISGNQASAGGGIYLQNYGSRPQFYMDRFTFDHTQGNAYSNIYGWTHSIGLLGPIGIGSFTASSNAVTAGSSLTLSASNIVMPGASITQVSFYYFDSTGAQHVLGNGTQTRSGAWTLTVKANLAPGTYTLYAQAEDSSGLFSDPLASTLTVR
jgi:hypothetical protein